MFTYLLCVPPNELWRQGVSNQERNCLLTAAVREAIAARETLEHRSFTNCDRSILLRMKKAPLGRIVAAAGDSRSDIIPCHAPVNILEAVALAMATKLAACR